MSITNNTEELIIVSNTGFTENKEGYLEQTEYDSCNKPVIKDPTWSLKINEIISPIFQNHAKDTPLFLYHLKANNHTFTIELADYPKEMDFERSIDPYFFLELQSYN